MGKKNNKKKTSIESTDSNEKLKVEAARELGLFDKARHLGWDMLTAQETGKIGALVKKKLQNCKMDS
ncbi:MAG TPA: small, acid-soluble spore protein, alpha/beta type [Thermoanaerobacterales bacterium]|nr:small, acid-soluble spore protein, alpha/beta type [Thermoanaerobacterales bacterium]